MPKLKPASEHWIVARKPLGRKNLAKNALVHDTGPLNIEGCRVNKKPTNQQRDFADKGRFPSNLLLSHQAQCNEHCNDNCAVGALDQQSKLDAAEFFNTFIFSPKAPKKERQEGVLDDQF